jgi:hypothetical protein
MPGVSDGLFVLDETYNADGTICVINPITGSTLRFAAQKPPERRLNVAVTGFEPLLVVFSSCCRRIGAVCADPNSELIPVPFSLDLVASKVRSMVAYGGYVYMVHENGSIFKVGGTAQNCHADLSADTFGLNLHDAGKKVCVLESAGDLIVVVRRLGGPMMQVFKLDVDQKVLEPVESLRGRAFEGKYAYCT